MQIACPNCKTRYQIEPAAIGAAGRSVRCARCQHVWFVPASGAASDQATPAANPAAAKAEARDVAAFSAELGKPALETELPGGQAAPEPEAPDASTAPAAASPPAAGAEADPPAHASLADITIPVADAPPLVPAPGEEIAPRRDSGGSERGDVETVAARRSRAAARARRRRRAATGAVMALLAVAIAMLLGLRKDVVQHVPQLASFYGALGLPVNLRGVAFTDLKIGNEIRDGVPVLVIEGAVVSITSKPVELPRLRFALRNAAGAEIYSWTSQLPQSTLEPFESLPFRTRLAAPPADGHDVEVRFFTRRDARANH